MKCWKCQTGRFCTEVVETKLRVDDVVHWIVAEAEVCNKCGLVAFTDEQVEKAKDSVLRKQKIIEREEKLLGKMRRNVSCENELSVPQLRFETSPPGTSVGSRRRSIHRAV